MFQDSVVRLMFGSIFFTVFAVGFYHRIKAHRQNDHFERMKHEGKSTFLILRICGFILWGMNFLFPFVPDLFAPVRFAPSDVLQWIGLFAAIIAIPMGISVFTSIGKNITDTVETRKGHQLVTGGIYRFIRHPLYSTGFLLFIGLGLLASNWLSIILSFVVLITLYVRTYTEEDKLIEEFGDRYVRYRQTTGKFFPKFF